MYDHEAFTSFLTQVLTLIYQFFMRNWWLAGFLIIPVLTMVITLVKSIYNKE